MSIKWPWVLSYVSRGSLKHTWENIMSNNETRCPCCGLTETEREQLFVIGKRMSDLDNNVSAFLAERDC
jgi:hypothetical protein